MADYDSEERGVEDNTSSSASPTPTMTLQKAVDLREYDPEYLATFAEWHILSKHIQFQFSQQGLKNRSDQLIQQYAAKCNLFDFSKKPHLQEALDKITNQQRKLRADKEKLLMEYSGE